MVIKLSNSGVIKLNGYLSITSYMGGKQKLLGNYLNCMKDVEHDVYIETCAGMGSICLNFPTAAKRIVNDFNIGNALLFKTLSSDYSVRNKFLYNLENAYYTEDIFNRALEYYSKQDLDNKRLEDYEGDSLANIGAALYVLFRMSYGGIINGSFNEPDSYSKINNFRKKLYELPEITERLQGVTVMNKDASELIKEYSDNENAFIFVDPPYLTDDTDEESKERSKNASKAYNAEIDYDILLPEMLKSKSKIMLCNYNSSRLQKELVGNGWKRIFMGVRTVDSGIKKGQNYRKRADEYIYKNF